MKKFFFLLLITPTFFSSFAQRDTIWLNTDWQFCTDKKSVGNTEKWFNSSPPQGRTVKLPHTWNIEEENQNHYGWGWYQKKLVVPAEWKNKNVVPEIALSVTEENQPTQNTIHSSLPTANWENGIASFDIQLPKINPWHFDFGNGYIISQKSFY